MTSSSQVEPVMQIAWLKYLLGDINISSLSLAATTQYLNHPESDDFLSKLALSDSRTSLADVRDAYQDSGTAVDLPDLPPPDAYRGQGLTILKLTLAGALKAEDALRMLRRLSSRDAEDRRRTMQDFDQIVGLSLLWDEYPDQRARLESALQEEATRLISESDSSAHTSDIR